MYYSFDPGEARRRHQALLQVAEANRLARRALRHRRAKRRLDIAQHARQPLIRTTTTGLA